MAIRKTIEIDVNAKSAIKSLEELGGSFEDANGEGAIPLSTTIGELEDRLYAMSAAGDTASKEFKEIAGQVGKMKKVIIDTDLTLDGMSQNLAQNVGGALTGVASGFALAQGAMGAFGVGGEDVEKALLKVQSAMAMAQGLQGLKEGVASFKALKSAIMASTVVQSVLNVVMSLNPIGLIVLAVAALAAGIALLWSPIKKLGQLFGLVAEETETAAESNDKLNASIEKQTALMEANRQKSKQVHDDRMRQLALNDATEKEMHEANLDRLKEVEDERQKDMKSTISVIRKKRKRYRMAAKEGEVELAREIKKEIQDNKKKLNTLKSQRKNYNLSVKEANKEFNAGIAADNAQEIADEAALRATNISNYKAYLDKKLAAERRIEDLKNGLIKDDEEKALAIRNAKFARDIEDLKTTGKLGNETKKLLEEQLQLDLAEIRKKGIDKEKQEEEALKAFKKAADEQFAMDKEAFEEKLYQDGLSKDAAEIQAVESKYFNLIALAEQYGLDTVALKEKETAELEAISKASADKQTALDKDVKDSKVAIAQNGLQLVSDLAGMFADRSEKAAKIAFNVQKAASIAQATISGIEATINAFKTASASPITVGFPAFPFIQAGLAGAFAAANIAKIASSKFGGGGSGGGVGNVSAPSGAGGVGGGGNAASFNVVGNTGVNQLAEGLGNQNQQPIQAFVVGSEVTTQQSLDRNKIETATI